MSTDFKSALPPRKRAKTKEEKEQRRVERILRNRRAAHASREKKRKHVEYLESYVLKLEANLDKLQANFQAVVEFLDLQALEKANVAELEDIAHLKDQVHANLNGVGCNGSTSPEDGDGDDDDEVDSKFDEKVFTASNTPTKKRKLEQISGAISSEAAPNIADISPPTWAVERNKEHESCSNTMATKSKDEFLTVASENGSFYNYLSPISMGSPMNSPIDLKLETEGPEQQPSMLDTTTFSQDSDLTKGFNSMGQSSEETLLPRSSAAPINSQLFDPSLIEADANYLFAEGESGHASQQQVRQYSDDTKLETDLQADVTQFLNTSKFDSEFSGHIDIDEFLQL